MRSALGKAVRRRFQQQLNNYLPMFLPDPTAIVPQGFKVFRWATRPGLSCYVSLHISEKEDRFTIECAWSLTDTFPILGQQCPRAWPERGISPDEPVDGQFSFRMGQLWQPGDCWWWLVPEQEWIARLERFTAAVIAQDYSAVVRAMEDPPLEQAMANVQPMVDDAVSRIVNEAMPYFETIINQNRAE